MKKKELLRKLLDELDANTCLHEDIYRGGNIWTICADCRRTWADDKGGFKPHCDSPVVTEVRNLLNKK